MRTTAVAAGAAFFFAVGAIPYVTGRMVERDIRTAIDGYNKRQSFVTVSISEYDRQWLRSQFVTRVSIRGGPEIARADTRLRHPPFAGLRFTSGQSEVHFSDAYAATEQYYFSGDTPLTVMFDVDIGGGTRGVVRSAAVDRTVIASPDTKVVASSSSGTFSIAKDKTFKVDWTLPKLAFEDPKVSSAVEGVSMSAYGQLGDDDLSERSGFKLAVASYRGTQGARSTSMKHFSVSTQMTPSGDVLRFALAVATGAGDVKLDADTYAWDSFELACSLSDVQKSPVIKYSADLRGLSDVDVSDSQRVMLGLGAVSDLASGLAQGEPVFAVDKLDLRTADGSVEGSLRVSIDKARMAMGSASWTVSDGLVMSGRASVSRRLAVHLVGAAMGSEPGAQAIIEQLASRGVVRVNGDALEFDVAGREGVYTLNGVRASELVRM